MGVGFAWWVAQGAFWILLVAGWFAEEIGPRAISVFVALWLGGLFGMPVLPYGGQLFAPYVAVLDIALVFAIFKGDVRLH
jgi:hypothetical protein